MPDVLVSFKSIEIAVMDVKLLLIYLSSLVLFTHSQTVKQCNPKKCLPGKFELRFKATLQLYYPPIDQYFYRQYLQQLRVRDHSMQRQQRLLEIGTKGIPE